MYRFRSKRSQYNPLNTHRFKTPAVKYSIHDRSNRQRLIYSPRLGARRELFKARFSTGNFPKRRWLGVGVEMSLSLLNTKSGKSTQYISVAGHVIHTRSNISIRPRLYCVDVFFLCSGVVVCPLFRSDSWAAAADVLTPSISPRLAQKRVNKARNMNVNAK